MFMVMAANFQVEGRDDIPACVLKMQTSIKQLDLIMSMINQLPHAASAGSVSAKVAVSMYPLRCMASSRHLSRAPRLEVNSGDPVSTSGWAVLNAARLALLVSLARSGRQHSLEVEDLEGHCGIISMEYGHVEWSPRQSVDDLLGPVV